MLSVKLLAAGLLLAMLAGCSGGLPLSPSPAATYPPMAGAAGPTVPAPAAGASPPTPAPRPAGTVPPAETAPQEPADGFPAPPERDFFRLVRELKPGVVAVERAVADSAPALEAGHRQWFNLVDLRRMEEYRSEFELRLVTPNAYWFVEDGQDVDQPDLERAAAEFENAIYPRVTAAFGNEWKPGVDGDPRLYVLNANLPSVGGYYNPEDEYPREIRPSSNEIEAIYINTGYLVPGTPDYAHTLAHELQHAVHWRADPTEESWVNEGLSELAVTIAGLPNYFMGSQRFAPTSLTVWPAASGGGSYMSYSVASSFMHYLTWHYSGRGDLRPLLSQQADGIDGVNAFLEAGGYEARFEDAFRDWAVANLLNEDSGPYNRGSIDLGPPIQRPLREGREQTSSIPQYATEYFRLARLPERPVRLYFDGQDAAPLLPTEVGEGCWWSNNGDAIDSTLTRRVDLRRAQDPVLTYQVWFAIEEDWDYAYLEVSEDGGETWQILETPLTSSADPLNVAFGPGYTGSSGGWRDETVSLSDWAGQEILLRFQYITDAAANDHGLCLRNAGVRGIGPAAMGEWMPNGFVWTPHNLVRQNFIVQAIYAGAGNRVLPLELDGQNRGALTLNAAPGDRYVAVAVQALAPSTRLPARYTIRLEPVE